jgi:hypothetical protein
MISRTYDVNLVTEAVTFLLKHNEVDVEAWLSNPDNIALVNDDGDMALFERGVKHIYTGHYYFKSRGRKAITVGKDFLDNLFNTCYNISILTGLVPLTHLSARWMTRQLGFTSHGVIHIDNKHYEMFIITKKEFNGHE